MEELISKLLTGEGKLSLLLVEAKEIAEKSGNKEFIEFIDNEINGYSTNELPEYRKIKAQIIGVIKDSYGRIVKQGEPINFSVLSESIGFDVAETHIPDGIGFIEDGLENVTGQLVERPLHNQIVKMLNDVFKHNNPMFNLTSASHQFGRAGIQFILTKVRQDLILGLKKIKPTSPALSSLKEIVDLDNSNDKIPVFVTYAWEEDEHNDKVISFVDFLRKKGYEATMDRKESQEQSATDFNEMMVNGIHNSEKVVVILSKKYKEKADIFTGGVGFEYKIILEQLKKHTNKFIFASFGNEPNENIVPVGIGARDILNLKKDQDETEFNILFSKLDSKNILNFSEVSETKVEVTVKEIKPFKL